MSWASTRTWNDKQLGLTNTTTTIAERQISTAPGRLGAGWLDERGTRLGDSEVATPLRITVRRQREVTPLEVEMRPTQTIAELKHTISAMGGVPVSQQRLYSKSCRLQEEMTLEACGLAARSEVQLVPALSHRNRVASITARRGFHMVTGSVPWKPSSAARMTATDISEFWGHDIDRPSISETAPKILPPVF